ncbi:phage holin, LLH family [Salicibibacter kimchii]|uniref:Holin n=1 Tax=Salicibibacter kimchii TaxID=2099786 RepID=A0A345BUK4_9BACI|nr:phage holin, LLH family [Salicibibacter kimchii]AXF54635.1 hypothetical protein DT065_00470 [Salicibibacter kimchii]
MEFIMEFVEGFGLIEGVVTAFLAFLGFIGGKLKPFLEETLKSVKKESDSYIISTLAEQGVRLINERFKGESGYEKFEHVTAWLAERAREREIPIKEDEIRGAIQEGYDLSIGKEKKKTEQSQ